MKFDTRLVYGSLAEIPDLAHAAERTGFDGIWLEETAHEPFLGAALACEHTARVDVGTNVAIAFARSPTVLAHLAWDLAALSAGRFILGLGTQVKGHVVRRFGMPWDAPAPRLRDTIRAIRAVWAAWRSGEPLNYRGQFYTLTLMTPFFTPPHHDYPIPVATAGVNPTMCRVAGEVADAFQVHPLHTPSYLREVILPAIRRGERRAGRGRTVTINASVFALIGESLAELDAARAEARRTIAFYASTPSYRPLLTHHGWDGIGARLSALAARGEWIQMAGEVTDEMLETIAVSGSPREVGRQVRARYDGLADRVGVYLAFRPDAAARWGSVLDAARA
ncbi:MAG TPA: TIGR03617 family F420-dependent LLM class oxidoreductase [bacterium]|nr:TIGR03617 family F420-dependent LLM class oxidoreductase [bacterium]